MFTAAGKSAAVSAANYIEEVFSTYLYTGNGSTQTITNGIDLAGKGGLVWIKSRSNATGHHLSDTATGITNYLVSESTLSQQSGGGVTSANSNGFGLTASGGGVRTNTNGNTYVSWTFREQAKFFDVVTYTGNGVSGRQISHNLGSTPGFIIIKRTDTTSDWACWHRSLSTTTSYITLNSTNQSFNDTTVYNAAPTNTYFQVGTDAWVNANGGTYVAYLFAHDAGGFGATGADNVISCGSFTQSSAADVAVSLGYEPQWVLVKQSNTTGQWNLLDDMRGFLAGNNSVTSRVLRPNLSNAEADFTIQKTATGFTWPAGQFSVSAGTYIYIAIRRGPMKTPTSGTSVFGVQTTTATGSLTSLSAPDTVISRLTGSQNFDWNSAFFDRLRGNGAYIVSSAATQEQNLSTALEFNSSQFASQGISSSAMAFYLLDRAPGFFDVVCYTGTGANRTVSHNLTVVPEMMIVKRRDTAASWTVYTPTTGNTGFLVLNNDAVPTTSSGSWNNTSPTSSVFTVGTSTAVNGSGGTYVAYLFASCPGVSKVGSYTGTGALQTINCGFASGARFVFIKRTDSTGDWWVYDSARGITSSNDPYFFFNTAVAQVTNTNYVDTTSVGFQVTAAAPAGLNANGGTYIFLAIA